MSSNGIIHLRSLIYPVLFHFWRFVLVFLKGNVILYFCDYWVNEEVYYLFAFLCTSLKCLFPSITHLHSQFNQPDMKLLQLFTENGILYTWIIYSLWVTVLTNMALFEYGYANTNLLLLFGFHSLSHGVSLIFNTVFSKLILNY